MEMFDCGTNNRNRTIKKLFVIQITVFDGHGIFNILSISILNKNVSF